MKAIFWKEWRENWKWAALAMLALGAAEFYGLLGESQTTSYMGENGLLRSAFLLATTFGHATVGFLLGLTQFRPEQNRDRWAVLLHRPAPRSALFLGKVLAGLALYLLAAAPALAASVLYAATPGHFAYPFLPGMVRPAAADLVAGFAFYGAAIFLVLERRWAARILGILAAALTIGVSLSEGSFRVALEATTAMSLVLLLAAWASMGGPANSRAGRIALFAVLFYGACGAGGLLLAIHSLLVSRDNYSGRELIVTEDGDPVWLKFSNGRQTIVDLQDQPLRDPRYTAFDRYNHLKTFERVCFLVGDSHGLSRTPSPEAYRGATCYATSLGRSFEEPWYYIPSQRLLRGYDGHSRRPTGVADQTGFHALGTAATPLAAPVIYEPWNSFNPFMAESGGAVYVFDAYRHQFSHLPQTTPIYGFRLVPLGERNSRTEETGVVIAGESDLAVYSLPGATPVVRLPYVRDSDHWGTLSFAYWKKLQRYYVHASPSAWIPEEQRDTTPSYLDVFDAQGKPLRSYEIPPAPPHKRGPVTLVERLNGALRSPAYIVGNWAYNAAGSALHIKRLHDRLQYDFGTPKARRWQLRHMAWVCGAAALFSATSYILARRRHFSARSARNWALLVFALNLGGFVVFLLAAPWPVEEPCPSCGRKRPVDRDLCPACGAGWPAPAPDGTEIFDSVRG